jgi:phosphoglycolate phosphatase-like HAD superfamily hydrolase
VRARGVAPPEARHVRAFIADDAFAKSNDGLVAYRALHPEGELDQALAWSKAVNAAIADMVQGVPPFPGVCESLSFLASCADILVVSATPQEALEREWEEHNIARHVRAIAGQEMGTKAEHLGMAAGGKYRPDHILMIGDAPGDLKAARANSALFFPINPGHEEESWDRFLREAVHWFLSGEYAGEYEARLIAEFDRLLPEAPPWKT